MNFETNRRAAERPQGVHLLIGGYGLVGTAIREVLAANAASFIPTTRREPPPGWLHLDLAKPMAWQLPMATRVLLVAALPGFGPCEGNPLAYRINVDAPIEIAREMLSKQPTRPPFITFMSTDAVENLGLNAYARHKQIVECYMRTIGAAIIRPSKITPDNVAEFARAAVAISDARRPGIYHWTAPMRVEAAA